MPDGFKIAEGYVEIRLEDSTEADYDRIHDDLAAKPAIELRTALSDPDTATVDEVRRRLAGEPPVELGAVFDTPSTVAVDEIRSRLEDEAPVDIRTRLDTPNAAGLDAVRAAIDAEPPVRIDAAVDTSSVELPTIQQQVVQDTTSDTAASSPASVPTELAAPQLDEQRIQDDLQRQPPLQLPTELGAPSQGAVQTERAKILAAPSFQVPTALSKPSEAPVDRARAALEGEPAADVPTALGEPSERKVDEARVRIAAGAPIVVPTMLSTDSWEVRYQKARELIEGMGAVEVETEASDPITEAWRAKVKAELKGIASDAVSLPVNADMMEFREQVLFAVEEIDSAVHAEIPVQLAAADRFKAEVLALAQQVRAEVKAEIPVVADPDSAKASGDKAGSLMTAAIAAAVTTGGPLIGAGLVAGTAVGLTALGVYLQKGDPAVQAGWKKLSTDAKASATEASQSMVPPIQAAMTRIDQFVEAQEPLWESSFAGAARDIEPLTTGLEDMADRLVPSVNRALQQSEPIVQGVSHVLDDMGQAGASVLDSVSSHAQLFGSVLDNTGTLVSGLGATVGSVMPGMAAGFSTTTGTATGMLTVVRAMGPELGKVAGFAPDVVLGFKAFSTISPKLDQASSKLSTYAGKMSGATVASRTAQSATNGLAGVLGSSGALGLAIGGAMVLFAALGKAQQDAAQKEQQTSDAAQQTAQVLEASKGAINDVALASEAAALQGQPWVQTLTSQGVSLRDVTAAALGVPGALQKVQDQVNGLGGAHSAADNVLKTVSFGLLSNSDAANKAKDALGILDGVAPGAAKDQSDLADASGKSADGLNKSAAAAQSASSWYKDMNTRLGELQTKESGVQQAASNLALTLQTLGEGGMEKVNDAIRLFASNLSADSASLKSAKGDIVDASGAIDNFSAKGQAAAKLLEDSQTAWSQYATGARAAGVSSSTMTDEMETMRSKLVTTLEQMGLNAKSANNLADQYGLIPANVATDVTTPGIALTFQNIAQVKADLKALPPNTSVTVTGLTGPAETKLEALGYDVTHLPNGTVTVKANDNVTAEVNRIIRLNSGKTITVNVSTGQIHAGPGSGFARGALIQPNAVGNIDTGGPSLTPMSGSVATVVPPDTWRVIGDNMSAPELFAPLDGSQRSKQLIAAAAANQGVSASAPSTTTVEINNYISVQDNDTAYALAHRVSAQTQWDLMTTVDG